MERGVALGRLARSRITTSSRRSASSLTKLSCKDLNCIELNQAVVKGEESARHKLTTPLGCNLNVSRKLVRPSSSKLRTRTEVKEEFRKVWRSNNDILGAGRSGINIERNTSRHFSSNSKISAESLESIKVEYTPAPPPPLNAVEVPLISPNLRSQIFPPTSSPYAPSDPTQASIDIALDHLHSHGLASIKKSDKPPAPAVDFTLPKLHGPTISHHFHALGQQSASPYIELAQEFASPSTNLPPMPEKHQWVLQPGWTFYSPDGSFESVEWPREDEQALVFDVETLPFQAGHFPIMAVAAGVKGWYAWFSPWITGDDKDPNHLIPFSEDPSNLPSSVDDPLSLFEKVEQKPRLLIGHNVLFDRARVSSEYTLRRPNTRWLDTLSLHVAVSGITNPQRPAWLQDRKSKTLVEAAVAVTKVDEDPTLLPPATQKSTIIPPDGASKRWQDLSSPNSLVEVARLHIGTSVDKSIRNIFIDPAVTPLEVREHFDELINYCAKDVLVTYGVYKVLLPKFLNLCPHPASFGGILLMSQPILPVDKQWPQYLDRADSVYQQRLKSIKKSLETIAEEAKKLFEKIGDDGKYVWENDIWLKQLDWSPKKAKGLRRKFNKLAVVAEAESSLPITSTSSSTTILETQTQNILPAWYNSILKSSKSNLAIPIQSPLAALLFKTAWRTYPTLYTHSHGWLFAVPSSTKSFKPQEREELVDPSKLGVKDSFPKALKGYKLYSVPAAGKGRCMKLLGWTAIKWLGDEVMSSPYSEVGDAVVLGKETSGKDFNSVSKKLESLAKAAVKLSKEEVEKNLWLRQLDWTPTPTVEKNTDATFVPSSSPSAPASSTSNDLVWPQWYWDLTTTGEGFDISIGKRATPLLLKLRWKGFPIVYSVAHGWIYRVPIEEIAEMYEKDFSLTPLEFGTKVGDMGLFEDVANDKAIFFKLPHPDGEGKNVGSPLSRSFVTAFEDGTLTSEYSAAADALAMNASCSYWTSSRERIMNQMVIWEGDAKVLAPIPERIQSSLSKDTTRGLILPQVVPMGTVTRRSVEKTWLTASNAKKNRVGSELKSMVQAPPGYAIVGADVDSEELWICSVMGDAQFGVHGATAIGWMGLEGTKAAGTDLHSKTAKILGISRDDAKVFNYSRIYGAGVKHAIQLLLKSNPGLAAAPAKELSEELYANTKGLKDRTPSFGRTFWHGGTESFVFNKLEQIAESDTPTTPALGCGVTDALKKAHLPAEGRTKAGQGFMPSRINWVVQSSGVDYLHLLLVSMEYLTKRFGIDARYMISVHDEVRYIVKEEDKFRAAMAMQISNIWTRSLFSYRLQMSSLPESCAFFSAVDIDHVFRKEVNMNCLTPSNPDPIPFGISYDINDSLTSTSNGSLFADGRSMDFDLQLPSLPYPQNLSDIEIKGEQHRVDTTPFLIAQTKSKVSDVRKVWNDSLKEKEISSGRGALKRDFKSRQVEDVGIERKEINTLRVGESHPPWDEILASYRASPLKVTTTPRRLDSSKTIKSSKLKSTSTTARLTPSTSASTTAEKTKSGRILTFKTRPGVARVVPMSKREILMKEWEEEDLDYDISEGLDDSELDETAASTSKGQV